MPLRVLLAEDSAADAKLIVRALERTGRKISCQRVETEAAMRAALLREPFDIVISDWSMPLFSALGALAVVKEVGIDLPFIIVSGTMGEETAVEAMRSGAHDYVLKEKLTRLAPAVERELRESDTRKARRTAEKALLESEARYRRIIETTNEGVWQIDAETKTTFMNARMAQMLAVDLDQVKGVAIAEFLDPRGLSILSESMRHFEAGLPHQVEVELKRTDGTMLWALLETSPILDSAGRFEGALAMVMDVTERKRNEESLREAELRFRRLFESGIIGVTVTETTGAVTEANDTFLQLLGYSRDELDSGLLNWIAMTPPEWRNHNASVGVALRAQGSALPWEKEYLRKDGIRVPVMVGVARLDETRSITVTTDLTARRSAEERKLAVVSSALDAVIVMDAKGVITEFNPAAERIFGYSTAEAIGHVLSELLIPVRFRAAYQQGLALHVKTGEGPLLGKRIELVAMGRGAVEFPVELSLSRIGSAMPRASSASFATSPSENGSSARSSNACTSPRSAPISE